MKVKRAAAIIGLLCCFSCSESATPTQDGSELNEANPHVWSDQTDALKRAKEVESQIEEAAKSRAEQLDQEPNKF